MTYDEFRAMLKQPPPKSQAESQGRLVDLWLSDGTSRELLILAAYRFGIDEGRRQVEGKEELTAAMPQA